MKTIINEFFWHIPYNLRARTQITGLVWKYSRRSFKVILASIFSSIVFDLPMKNHTNWRTYFYSLVESISREQHQLHCRPNWIRGVQLER